MTRVDGSRAYYAGAGVALVTSFLIVWTSIVRDDGQAMGNFGVIMAAMVGSFATRFQPRGIARAMLGVAVMQVLIGIAIATAPIHGCGAGWGFQSRSVQQRLRSTLALFGCVLPEGCQKPHRGRLTGFAKTAAAFTSPKHPDGTPFR